MDQVVAYNAADTSDLLVQPQMESHQTQVPVDSDTPTYQILARDHEEPCISAECRRRVAQSRMLVCSPLVLEGGTPLYNILYRGILLLMRSSSLISIVSNLLVVVTICVGKKILWG
jgi:hypothetical protein